MKPLSIKICGVTNPGDARDAIAAGADLLGFVFVPGTPRALRHGPARWIRRIDGVQRVGVFRDQALDLVLEIRRELALDWVQLHGDEPDSWLDILGPMVLRRVPVAGGVDWDRVAWLARRCLPLIDPGAGDGLTPDWGDLGRAPAGLPFGLAGGLTPRNVGVAIRRLDPVLVDVSSGVESAPGRKDREKMRAFVEAARSAASGGDPTGAVQADPMGGVESSDGGDRT